MTNATALWNRIADDTDPAEAALIASLADALNDLDHIEGELRRAGSDITERIARTVTQLDNGRHVNNLGELQGLTSTFDRLCGERERQIGHVKQLQHIANHFGLDITDADLF